MEMLELKNPKAAVQMEVSLRQKIFRTMLVGQAPVVPCPTMEPDSVHKPGNLSGVLTFSFYERSANTIRLLLKDYYINSGVIDLFAAGGEVACACSLLDSGDAMPYTGAVFCPEHATFVGKAVDEHLLMELHGNAARRTSLLGQELKQEDFALMFPLLKTKIDMHGKACVDDAGSDAEGN